MIHPIRVAMTCNHPLLGLMHDSVEDGYWPKWLAWPALDAITRRDGEAYADYIERVALNAAATDVKIADLRDNLSRGDGPPGSLRKRYERALQRLTNAPTR